MAQSYPEIRIKDAWLLRENASKPLHELWGKGGKLADDALMEKIVKDYRQAWQPHEQKILKAMCSVLDLTFRQNIIDVYIAPWFHAFSDPLVIGVMQRPDEFIDTLTHELLHRLQTDNTKVPYDAKLTPAWQKLFGKQHKFNTIVHIPVHAVHKLIYLDVLDSPKRHQRDIDYCKKHGATDYVKSWEYVDSRDYKEITAQLKELYQTLGSKK